jgi:DNA-binding MarR family transcriptional regulator
MEPAVEDFIIEVACTLASELRRQIRPKGCLNGMRNLGGPSEKLIYMYLWLTQPQTFSEIRRNLNVSKTTLARVLRLLENKHMIRREGLFLYTAHESDF